MDYEPIAPVRRADAERAAACADTDALSLIVLSVALHEADAAWAEAFCARFARHPDALIRGNALLGLGHLTRRFGRLDAERTRPLLRAGLADPDARVRGQAQDAAEDAEVFLGCQFPPAEG